MKDYLLKAVVPLLSVLIGIFAGALLTSFTESTLQFEKRRSETIFNLLEPIRSNETLQDALRRGYHQRVRFAIYASPESLDALAELIRHGCVDPTPEDIDFSDFRKLMRECEDRYVALVWWLREEVGADLVRQEMLTDALGMQRTIDAILPK